MSPYYVWSDDAMFAGCIYKHHGLTIREGYLSNTNQ